MARSTPAPNKYFQVRSRVTPLGTDVLFYENVDSVIPRDRDPTYGSAHWDPVRYPAHQLVFITPADEHGVEKWYYAADRDNQDLYNFEHAQADIGETRFDAVERTYIIPRDAYDPVTPAQGAAMPNVPASLFTGSYVLAGRREIRTQEKELDSLYVAERRIYVKRTTLTDIKTNEELGVGVGETTQFFYRGESSIENKFANPGDAYWGYQADGTKRDGRQLTSNWFVVITTSSLDDALDAYYLSIPSSVNLNLPDVLESIDVVWNSTGQDGSFESESAGQSTSVGIVRTRLSANESASAQCSASVQPELSVQIRQPWGRDIPSTAYFFFLKQETNGITDGAFLARLGEFAGSVSRWPTFNPVSHTIVLKGQKASAQAEVSAAASTSGEVTGSGEYLDKEVTTGVGESHDVSGTIAAVKIPPTIHPWIFLSNADPVTLDKNAVCSVEWEANYSGPTIAGLDPILPIPSSTAPPGDLFPADSDVGVATKTASISVEGSVSPVSLGPTDPIEIPTSGLYLVNSKIEPYIHGWLRCYAEVIDAADVQ